MHHEGFGFHADAVAPGILSLLGPVLERDGVVLELGCGSGLLTRYLVDAGHRVIATDASPAMLDLARRTVPGASEIRELVLPDDPLPACDAVVAVGHPLNYLPSEDALFRALVAACGALRPGGVIAVDLEDLAWGRAWIEQPPSGWLAEGWALVMTRELPSPNRFVRTMAIFSRNADGETWRRDDERHENVLIDTALVPPLLAEHGVEAEIRASFGSEQLPPGLVAVVGRKVG